MLSKRSLEVELNFIYDPFYIQIVMNSDKMYPKSQVYSNSQKSAFQNVNKVNECKKIMDLSGTSMNEFSQSYTTSQANQVLKQRVEELEKQVQELSGMVDEYTEYEEKVKELMGENQILKQNLISCRNLNCELEEEVSQRRESEQKLTKTCQKMKQELNQIHQQLLKYDNQCEERQSNNDLVLISKDLQQKIYEKDNIISQLLLKLDVHVKEANQSQDKIQKLQYQNHQLKQLSQSSTKKTQFSQWKEKYEDMEEANRQLKEEIEKVVEMSIANQKELQSVHVRKEHELSREIEDLKTKLKGWEEKKTDKMKELSITNLENDKDYLKNELKVCEYKLGCEIKLKQEQMEENMVLKKEMEKLLSVNENYKEQESIIRQTYQNKIRGQKQEISCLNKENEEKSVEIQSAEENKNKLITQMQQIRNNFIDLREEVSKFMNLKQKYILQVKQLKETIDKLQQDLLQSKNIVLNLQNKLKHMVNSETIERVKEELEETRNLFRNQRNDKERQNMKYRQVLDQYKKMNEELANNLEEREKKEASVQEKQLEKQKEKYNKLVEKNEEAMAKYGELENEIKRYEGMSKELNFLKVDNSSFKAKIQKVEVQRQSQMDKIKKYEQNESRLKNELQSWRQKELKWNQQQNQFSKFLHHSEIMKNELREKELLFQQKIRQVKEYYEQQMTQVDIRQRPQYKHLQTSILNLEKKNLQNEQIYRKSLSSYEDQINKLKIQNQFHRNKINELHALSYTNLRHNNDKKEMQNFHNAHGSLYYQFQQLYQNYSATLNQVQKLHHHQSLPPFYHQKQALSPECLNFSEKYDELNDLINRKLMELEITPREPTSITERIIWLVEKSASMIVQYKKDIEILRKQKKELGKENEKQRLQIQIKDDENNKFSNLLDYHIERTKLLEKQIEERNCKFDFSHLQRNGEYSSKNSHRSIHRQIPKLDLKHENDVYEHEASQMKEQRSTMLQMLKRDIHRLTEDQQSV